MYQRAIAFEKQHGDRGGIEDVIVGERRFQYEEEVAKNPRNYDTWFDYCRLEENAGDPDKVREVGCTAWCVHGAMTELQSVRLKTGSTAAVIYYLVICFVILQSSHIQPHVMSGV